MISGSAISQVYNATAGEYEPNRVITPTIITPEVMVNDVDGIFGDGNANRKLANLKWYIDDVELTTLSDYANGLYLIDTTDTMTRGSLTIYKNVAAAAPKKLSFRATLPDSRRSLNITIALDNILLSTQDISADKYTLEINQPIEKVINPVTLIDYYYAINCIVYRGGDKLTDHSGMTFNLYYISGTNIIEVNLSNSPEVLSVANGVFTFDLRMIQKRDYMIRLFQGTDELASLQFSINRVYPVYVADLRTYGDLRKDQTIIPATSIIHAGKTLITDPGKYFTITWHTYSATVGDIVHNLGEQAEIPAQDTGLEKGAIDVYFDLEEKPKMEVATNSIDEFYTDNLSEPYIFN